MGKELQKYKKNPNNIVEQTTRVAMSAKTRLEVTYSAANRKGHFRQLEADIILEYEIGLSPRRGSLAQ